MACPAPCQEFYGTIMEKRITRGFAETSSKHPPELFCVNPLRLAPRARSSASPEPERARLKIRRKKSTKSYVFDACLYFNTSLLQISNLFVSNSTHFLDISRFNIGTIFANEIIRRTPIEIDLKPEHRLIVYFIKFVAEGANLRQSRKQSKTGGSHRDTSQNSFRRHRLMFSGIEFVIGGLGALVGIGGGYLILNAFFAGIQRIAKPRTVEVKQSKEKRLDN